jgi:hypothetical protein
MATPFNRSKYFDLRKRCFLNFRILRKLFVSILGWNMERQIAFVPCIELSLPSLEFACSGLATPLLMAEE